MTSYSALPNKLVSAPDGVDYAYREAGQRELPLILLPHHAELAADVAAFLG